MKVIIACEESQVVCVAFRKLGHEAFSCDLVDCSGGHPEWHIQDDVLKHLNDGWDLMVAHPPCTYLSISGIRWLHDSRYPNRVQDQINATKFFMNLVDAPINKIAIENPIGIMSRVYRKPDQIIQPYYFGDKARKTTCLWLKNLNPLFHLDRPNLFGEHITHVDDGGIVITKSKRKWSRWFYETSLLPYEIRGRMRSKTFNGIAQAMAEQWGR
jgi:hypothetical protein